MEMDHPMKKTVHNPPCDKLSSLPVNVIETILTCLPFRDAVRTSTLSRKWRYYWLNIPKLVFDDTTLFAKPYSCDKYQFMMIVFQILLRHTGPILNFSFYGPGVGYSTRGEELFSAYDHLIHFLSRNGAVQEFTFSHSGVSNRYKLPLSFFSCAQLSHLHLSCCVFKPPPGFNGFSRLVSLNFRYVEFDPNFDCPLLERVTLRDGTDSNHLEFDAPVLKSLRICSRFSSIRFKNTPLLAFLSITSNGDDDSLEEGETSKMIEVFGGLPGIQELQSKRRFLKFLTFGGVPEKLPFILNQLKILQLDEICFGEPSVVSVVLCLIKSSPNLEKIKIEVKTYDDDYDNIKHAGELIQLQHLSDFSLNRLQEVRMSSIWGTTSELQFIKLILAKSSVLEKMLVQPSFEVRSDDQFEMLKVLNKYKRGSTEAEIIFR